MIKTDLHEAEVEAGLEERINRRDERLDRVVEQMRKTDREEDREHGAIAEPESGSVRLGAMGFGHRRVHDEEGS